MTYRDDHVYKLMLNIARPQLVLGYLTAEVTFAINDAILPIYVDTIKFNHAVPYSTLKHTRREDTGTRSYLLVSFSAVKWFRNNTINSRV